MRKSDWKNWGAILSALVVSGSLAADAIGFLTNVLWQYIALGGFIIFAGIMWLKLRYLQSVIDEYKSKRPHFKRGDTIRLVAPEPNRSEYLPDIRLFLKNNGEKPAHNLHMCVGCAPDEYPGRFTIIPPEMSSANPIDIGDEIGSIFQSNLRYGHKHGDKYVPFKGVLVYCSLEYTYCEVKGKGYKADY